MPLHVEILYNEYNFAAAFAVRVAAGHASWHAAVKTLVIKTVVERRYLARKRPADESNVMSIRIENVSKRFNDFVALDHVNADHRAGRAGGPARAVGLRQDDAAARDRRARGARRGPYLLRLGEDATDKDVRERAVGFVFQHYALFRHMTVFENVAFGLRVKPKKERPSGIP